MTVKELEKKIEESTANELEFMLASYGGRNRSILRDKIFGESADVLERMIKHALQYKHIDEFLLSDN